MTGLRHDLTIATRSLRSSPAFAAMVILTLAIAAVYEVVEVVIMVKAGH